VVGARSAQRLVGRAGALRRGKQQRQARAKAGRRGEVDFVAKERHRHALKVNARGLNARETKKSTTE
jgi:hypothetical protein